MNEEEIMMMILNRLREGQALLLSGRSSVTAQALILSVWTTRWPVETAIAVCRFLNGQTEMRPRQEEGVTKAAP